MTNTVWNNPSGAAISTLQGYYQVNNYPNDAANQTTARDLGILVYHFINQYPDILNYTNQAQVTVKRDLLWGNLDTYNYSLPGAKYALKGVDGLKTAQAPGAFNYRDHQTGQSALNCCHYGRSEIGQTKMGNITVTRLAMPWSKSL